MKIYPSAEFFVILIASGIFFLAFYFNLQTYRNFHHRTLKYLMYSWIIAGFSMLLQAFSYFFGSKLLFGFYIFTTSFSFLALILAIDALIRYDIDYVKMLLFGFYFAAHFLLIIIPESIEEKVRDDGSITFNSVGIFGITRQVMAFFQLCLWAYYTIQINRHAPASLKKYSRINIIGGLSLGVFPTLIFVVGLYKVLPGSIFLTMSIGGLIIASTFKNQPQFCTLLISISNNQRVQFIRRIEQSLYQTEKKYRNLVENTDDIIIEISADQKILFANSATTKTLGYPVEYLIGRSVSEFIDITDIAKMNQDIAQIEIGKPYKNLRFEIKSQSGEFVHFLGNFAIRLNEKEVYDGYIVIAQNTTDLNKAEKALEQRNKVLIQAQKLESIGTLAGGIAHDFNNLLQSIMGFSEILLSEKVPNSEEYEYLKEIQNAAINGSKLAKQLLMFIRKNDYNFRALNMNDEISNITKTISSIIPKMIEVTTSLDPDIHEIKGDASQFQQVLMNLAVNARDAMPNGGVLTFSTKNVYLDKDFCEMNMLSEPGTYVLISVRDTGTGIPQKVLDRIFEPFFTTKEPGKGTGLGTFIVYTIIKNHKGMIKCYSEVGKGTEFKIYLPAIKEKESIIGEQSILEDMTLKGEESILIVDDEESIRKFTSKILVQNGYSVHLANSAEEAFILLEESKIKCDLMILDMIMPGMGGEKLLEKLLMFYKDASNIPFKIIISTGYSSVDNSIMKKMPFIKDYLVKPFNSQDFLRTIRKVLDIK
jgi:PAS domain S-box-containing protein